MGFFSVDILTPNRVIALGLPADSLVVPTLRGELNILPEHTHLITQLDKGILSLQSNSHFEHFAVHSGILKLLKDKIVILSKNSLRPTEVNVTQEESILEEIKKTLHAGELTEAMYLEKLEELKFSETKLRLSKIKK